MTRIRWTSPYVTMAIVLAMYVAKAAAKLVIGSWVHSPVISGDGAHNVADFIEAAFVILGVTIAMRPPSSRYPFGLKNVESILEVAIGIGLAIATVHVASDATVGIIRSARSAVAGSSVLTADPLRMGPGYFWWVTGVMFVSACASIAIGRYEIATGTRAHRPSIIADGRETLVDGCIEGAALLGILCEYQWNAPWIEYPLALGVAVLMARTAWELARRGFDGLLQRSLGEDIEAAVRARAQAFPGVVRVADLRTFRTGAAAVTLLKVETRCHGRAIGHLKRVMLDDLRQCLADRGFPDSTRYLRFERPAPNRRRDAYAITTRGGATAIAQTLESATHVRLCDIDDDRILRWEDVALPPSLTEAIELLREKRAQRLVLLAHADGAMADAPLGTTGITLTYAATCVPELLGM